MKNRTRSMVVLVGLVTLAGCKTADVSYPSPTELVPRLLSVETLGTRWRERQRDAFDLRGPENPVIDTGQFCTAGLSEASRLGSLAGQAGADVEMQMKESTRMLRMQVWSNADVDEFFAAAVAAVGACDDEEWTDTRGVKYSFDVVAGPDVGDDALHWKLLASAPSTEPEKMFGVAGRTSIVRYGNVLMLLEIGDHAADAASQLMDADEWATIVSKAGSMIDAG